MVIFIDTLYNHPPWPGALDLHFMLHRLWQKKILSLEIKCISLQQWYLGVWYLDYLLPLIHSTTTHHDLVPVTDISCSTDFVKIYVESRNKVQFSAAVIAGSMKPCIVIILDTLNNHLLWHGALDLHFMLHWHCPNFMSSLELKRISL